MNKRETAGKGNENGSNVSDYSRCTFLSIIPRHSSRDAFPSIYIYTHIHAHSYYRNIEINKMDKYLLSSGHRFAALIR